MKTYQTVIFDWDGCLANTLEVWLKAYQKAFKNVGLEPSVRDIIDKGFGNWNAAKAFNIKDSKIFMEEVVEEGIKSLKTVELHTNATETLQRLKTEGKKLALVSSSKRDWVLPALEKHQLIELFDVFIGAEDVEKHKPNPESIYKVLELFSCEKENAIMIGDSDKDILAGRNAGIDTCLYYPKKNEFFYTLDQCKALKPTYFIKELKELENII